jgi:hypothetical protein
MPSETGSCFITLTHFFPHAAGRYLLLAPVIQALGAGAVLELAPALPRQLFMCMAVWDLGQSAATVYDTFCQVHAYFFFANCEFQ